MRKYASSTISLRNLSICIAMLLVSSVWAAAQQEQVLYSFPTNSGFAADPFGGLIADTAGNLYGTTNLGGSSNYGSVYELSPPTSNAGWRETDLYSFGDGDDGGFPYGALVFDAAGNLYGTTAGGGSSACLCGTVFELSPPASPGGSWTLTSLYSFVGGNDGAQPHAGLVFDRTGNLYGTTSIGGGFCGSQGCGTVFELSPPEVPGGAWTETRPLPVHRRHRRRCPISPGCS
ncbi:MAG: choice-of-anchor tandem repeat GloVer-containing protein [Terriglobales bacterium]